MEQEVMLALALIVIAGGTAIYKVYQKVMADGVVTREELLQAIKEGAGIVEDTVEEVQEELEEAKE
tara:strand:+ start:864 stop:1061 length:198 start_codon:yes stop_codon:yes gene_type:complete